MRRAQVGETNSERFATADCHAEVAYPTNPCPNRRDSRETGRLKTYSEVARRFDAEITLLHCYSTPPSFDYAVGASALVDVTLHRNRVKAQLLRLCRDVQKSFAECRCVFTFGSLPVAILRASERLQSDLIAVPLSLDFVSDCWTTKELLDELIRRADCAVLGVPLAQYK